MSKLLARCIAACLWCLATMAFAQHIPGGSAPVEQALAKLVPAPLQVRIDARIAPQTMLTWQAASDWMTALRQAIDGAGLQVRPQFAHGILEVLPGARGPDAPVVQTTALPPTKPAEPAQAPGSAVAPPSEKLFSLQPGKRLDLQFSEWVKGEPWELLWSSEKSWIVPGKEPVIYRGSVDQAIEAAVRDLYANGLPVRLEIWEGNKYMEIKHAK